MEKPSDDFVVATLRDAVFQGRWRVDIRAELGQLDTKAHILVTRVEVFAPANAAHNVPIDRGSTSGDVERGDMRRLRCILHAD